MNGGNGKAEHSAREVEINWLFALVVAILISSAGAARAEIKTQLITVKQGGVEAHDLLVYSSSARKRPGVLVVPEVWGLNDYVKKRAKMLAELGYVALAVDVYGGGKCTTNAKEAIAWAKPLDVHSHRELRRRIADALATLKSEPMVDASKTAAIGYCFGGTTVLELARSGAAVNGVVSFHGHLATDNPAKPGEVKAKVLACHGAADPFTSPTEVRAFEEEMTKAKADWQIDIYSGAEHSFTNPSADDLHVRGLSYNPEADRRSWQAMKDFFTEIFK